MSCWSIWELVDWLRCDLEIRNLNVIMGFGSFFIVQPPEKPHRTRRKPQPSHHNEFCAIFSVPKVSPFFLLLSHWRPRLPCFCNYYSPPFWFEVTLLTPQSTWLWGCDNSPLHQRHTFVLVSVIMCRWSLATAVVSNQTPSTSYHQLRFLLTDGISSVWSCLLLLWCMSTGLH